MARPLTLGLVQMSMDSSAEKNRAHAREMVHEAARKGADIVCLPELFTSPYFCSVEDAGFGYAEPIPGPTSAALAETAKEAKVVLVGGSVHESAGGKFYNTSCVFGPEGQLMGTYRKTHIPHDEGFFEQHYFQPGDTGFRVFTTPKAKLGVLICYDQWYPEAARSNALLGAEIIFYPTAIGSVSDVPQTEGKWQQAWEDVQRGHAIANATIVAAVNRVGVEGRTTFWGNSFVSDAFGKVLVRGGADEAVLIAEVDPDHNEAVKKGWRFFNNRRPDSYQLLCK